MQARGVLLSTLVLTGVAVAAPTVAVAALPAGCVQSGQSVTCHYGYLGSEQTFTVPAGVHSVQVTTVGAAGGTSYDGRFPGGRGARVSGVLSGLTPGSTLYVEVGQKPDTTATPQGSNVRAFNGGGASGYGSAAGGGGGASDVRTVSGGADPSATGLASRLIVAGGGGGRGETYGVASGVAGDAGADGQPATQQGIFGQGGKAGTQNAGGAGGAGSQGDPAAGNGVLGRGGDGRPGIPSGGGGGGGYYGGGGATGASPNRDGGNSSSVAGSGGGGSSLVPAGGQAATPTDAAASIDITYTAAPATLQFDAHAYNVQTVPGATAGKADLTCTVNPGNVVTDAPGGGGVSRVTGSIDGAGLRTATATATVVKSDRITTQGITVTVTAKQGADGQIATSATVTMLGTRVNGVVVPTNPAPNSTLPLPGGSLIVNEQIPVAGGLVVNAIHLRVLGGIQVIIGHAAAGLTAPGATCPTA